REPEKLVFVSAALDADGKPIFEVLNTVTLTERGGRTTLTVKARVLRKTPDADRYLKGMEEGWKLTLDRMQAFSTNPARQITLSRVFDAPVARVWEAFTDPKQTPLWWGPDGFTITSRSRKVKAGGSWDFIMHGPDGTDYPNFITYKEVVRHKRLVYEHGDEKGKAPEFVSTATFEKQGKKTRVTMTAVFSTTAIREFVAKEHHAVEGGQQTLGRLAEHLAKQG
ncbi:MAG TPA: SRPBCC domain-containing protein, partial [Planctomycetota bacterium]|nr:SRPBCC domain-containing protein [Planctomycetota bacterium]